MIFTGTASIIENKIIGYDSEGIAIYEPQEVTTFDSNFQNKIDGELKFSAFGLNDRDDNKYIFCEGNSAIKQNARIRNNNTMKNYEIVKVLDDYTDGHYEVIAKPVVGE